MKLSVPYYSQFVDIDDSFWMIRACGATSLKMVAEFCGATVPDVVTLCNEARDRGGYDLDNGWIHDYLVTKAKEFGLEAYRKEGLVDIDEIISALDAGNPVIVSVEKRVLEQTRFHMVVIVGYGRNVEEHGSGPEDGVLESSTTSHLSPITCLHYHEPESTNKEKGQYRTCTQEVFQKYWRGKAIFITK